MLRSPLARDARTAATTFRPHAASRFALLAALCAVAFAPRSARAQSLSPTERVLANEQWRAGLAAARADRWPQALESFSRAYALTHRPALLLNVASAQVHTGQLIAAAETYRRFLREATDPASAPYRDAGQRALALIEARIPRVQLEAPGLDPGDVLQLDGATLSHAALGTEIPLEPGRHTLVIVRESAPIARRDFDLSESAHERFALRVAPRVTVRATPAASVLARASAELRRTARPAPRARASSQGFPWTAVVLGTAAAVLVGGAVATTVWLVNEREISGTLAPGRLDVR